MRSVFIGILMVMVIVVVAFYSFIAGMVHESKTSSIDSQGSSLKFHGRLPGGDH